MSDIVIMEHKLLIAEQNAQIAEQQAELSAVKHQLEKIQLEKVSKLEDSLYSPHHFDHYYKVAEMLAGSGMVPTNYRNKPDNAFIAMAYGHSLGFPLGQCLQVINIVHGNPAINGDGLIALVLSRPDCESITENPIYEGEHVIGYTCTIKRKGHPEHTKRFTLEDAARAGLLKKGGAWSKYPQRMLQMRARAVAIRENFSDVLGNIRCVEELEELTECIVEHTAKVVSDKSQVEKLKDILKARELNDNSKADKIVHNNDVL